MHKKSITLNPNPYQNKSIHYRLGFGFDLKTEKLNLLFMGVGLGA